MKHIIKQYQNIKRNQNIKKGHVRDQGHDLVHPSVVGAGLIVEVAAGATKEIEKEVVVAQGHRHRRLHPNVEEVETSSHINTTEGSSAIVITSC